MIKDLSSRDDTHRIYEVMLRRLRRSSEEGWKLPDLFIIDGGKNQLRAAHGAAVAAGIDLPAIISIAKKRNNRSFEGIFFLDRNEINLQPDHPCMLLIDRIRDEAHRFAVAYHRSIKRKSSLSSFFDTIPRITSKSKRLLQMEFKTLDNLRKAKIDALLQIKGIGKANALHILEYIESMGELSD
jgi:excinuclease ABC subunit C